MRAEIVEKGGVTIVRLHGGIVNAADVIRLRQELQRVAGLGASKLVLSTNGIPYMSSEVIGEIAVFCHRAWRGDGTLRIVAKSEIPAFTPPNPDWLCEDEEQAVAQLTGARD